MAETLIDVLNEARDGRPYSLIARRVREAGVAAEEHTVRRWLNGDRSLPIDAADAVFTALGMDVEMRERALKAAAR